MKILRLDLRAYGPFTDAAIDFPADGPGLHLIHGPNEAGKTSTLRALRCLLFGYSTRIVDAFRHDAAKLRVGATIRGGDGSELTILRRRGKAKTLRGPDDEAVVDDEVLARRLGGITPERFAALFSTDLDELVAGGRAMIEGKGDLGATLFGGSGLARMPQVLRALRDQADALYKPRASKPTINEALAGLKAARQEQAKVQVSTEDWTRAVRERDEAVGLRDAAKAEADRLAADRRRLDRLAQALPVLARRDRAREELAALGPVTPLPDDFDARLVAARTARAVAEKAAAEAGAAIAEAEARFAAIDVPEALLAESGAIAALREGLGDQRNRRERRPLLLRQIDGVEAVASELLRQVAPGRTLDDARSLDVGKPRRDRIAVLGRERGAIFNEDHEARRYVAALEAQLAAESPRADSARLIDELAASLRRIMAQGDLDEADREAAARLRKHEAKAQAELSRLVPWSGTLADLAATPAPPDETLRRFEDDFQGAGARLDALKSEHATIAARVAEIDRNLADLLLRGDLPTEADLEQARDDRDRAWSTIRGAWLGGRDPGPADDLAIAFERHVRTADGRADALRREADRVARRAELSASRADLDRRAAALAPAIEGAAAALAAIESRWVAAWERVGIVPLSVAEMRRWRASYVTLLGLHATIVDARDEADRARLRRVAAIGELAAAMAALGEPAPAASESLAAWLDRAATVAERGQVARQLAAARAEAVEKADRLERWREGWARAVAPLGLPAEATPAEADEAIDRVRRLLAEVDALETLRDELAAADLATDRFAREVDALARRVGVDPGDRGPEAVLDAIRLDLDRAVKARQERDAQARTLEARRAQRAASEAAVVEQSALLVELQRLAGSATAEDLPAVIEASTRARGLRLKVATEEERLDELAGGRPVADLARDADGLDADTLPDRLDALDASIRSALEHVDRINQEVGRLDARLATIDGGPKAAEADESARRWLAAIEDDVEHYVRLRLAEAVLRRAIDAYRDRNQGPVLGRASDLFAAITAGAFDGLRLEDGPDSDPDARPVLVGSRVRPVKEPVPIDGMSVGTANALYLAIRLATLETHLDPREPLPFIVDDILVQFDDARASAALAALAQLATRTQVLFFTHHDHLVDLARSALPASSWSLHRLPGP